MPPTTHVDDDDQRTANTHPRDSPEPEQSPPVDGSQLSAEKMQKLFADLINPQALSHYADPLPDSAPNTQLVPYVRTSSTTAPTVSNTEPLETHGLFQNYQSFHRLSGDTEKEACTAAYHDLTNLMLSQTEEPSLINVSSSRPKTDDPFPCGFAVSNEMKKKQEKLHLQWPPQSDHNKIINRTLALYQHGPPPKSGTVDKWPPPPVPFGIHGIKTLSQKTFLLPTRFRPRCPNVGIFIPHLPSCSDLHSPRQCQRSRIQRFQSILLGWKPSQPGLLTPPPCPPLQWSGSITSSKGPEIHPWLRN